RVDREHSKLDEFVRLNFAGPCGADDLSLVVLFKVDLPALLELKVINLEFGREGAFDFARTDFFLVRNAHRVFLSRADRRFVWIDPNMCGRKPSTNQCNYRYKHQTSHRNLRGSVIVAVVLIS